MKTITETISAQRLSFFTRAIQYGVDLVRIVHINLHPTCPLCTPFESKILSITGHTKGYMSIEEATSYGLFHPRCDHIPEQLELAPKDNGNEGKIDLNEANKKRYEYNKKRFKVTENTNQRIKNSRQNVKNQEYPSFKGMYTNASVLAEKIAKEKGNTDNTVKHMREKISKEVLNNYYTIGNLNKEAQNLLGSATKKIKFSVDNLTKNIIKHPDIKFSDYLKIPDILKNYDEIKLDKKRNKSILLIKKDNKKYQVVIKTTLDNKENFLTSFRFAEH